MSVGGKTITLQQLASVVGVAIAVAGALAGSILWAENRYESQVSSTTQAADIRHDSDVAAQAAKNEVNRQLD